LGVVGFRYFGALDGPLGVILALFGPIWSQKWLQMAPSRPRMGHPGAQEAQAQPARALLEALASKMAPRWLQNGSRWPQVVQDSLLGAFLGLRRLSWKACGLPKTFKNQWFDVRFAFPWPPLCFSIAFAFPSLFLFLSNGGAPLSYEAFNGEIRPKNDL